MVFTGYKHYMKTVATILFLILQMTVVFGQSGGMIFPLSKNKIVFNCPQTVLHFDGVEKDSLDLTPSISFYLEKTPIIIDNISYYRFYLNKSGDSTCTGFLRKEKNKIYSISNRDSITKSKEKLLFDFGARIGSSWKTNMFDDLTNHKIRIKLRTKYFVNDFDEYLFDFEVTYRVTSGLNINDLIVGEKSGIVGVNFITHEGSLIKCRK